jgi:hypothetical protein
MEWLIRALTGQGEVSEDDDDECIGWNEIRVQAVHSVIYC